MEAAMKRFQRTTSMFALWISFLALLLNYFSLQAQTQSDYLNALQQEIDAHGYHWTVGDTPLLHLSPEELKSFLGNSTHDALPNLEPCPVRYDLLEPFDWSQQGYVTPVRYQKCGSCWAYASVAALESQALIQLKTPGVDLDFSEQFLVQKEGNDCGRNRNSDCQCDNCPYAGDCSGGYPLYAAERLKICGTPMESCAPDQGIDYLICGGAGCNWQEGSVKLAGYAPCNFFTIDGLKTAIYEHGPVPVSIQVYDDFRDYKSGVYESVRCCWAEKDRCDAENRICWRDDKSLPGDCIDALYPCDAYHTNCPMASHELLAVGWGRDEFGTDYFKCKNSWGTSWGEQGYCKVAFSQVENCVRLAGGNGLYYNGIVWPFHAIAGNISSYYSQPVQNVTMQCQATADQTIWQSSSDADGNYRFDTLLNGEYVLTPTASDLTFNPPNPTKTVNNADVQNVDFTASGKYSISGHVKFPNATSFSNVLVNIDQSHGPNGSLVINGQFPTDTSGKYSAPFLGNGTYEIAPHSAGYCFSPALSSLTINGASKTQAFTAYCDPSYYRAIDIGQNASCSVKENNFVFYYINVPAGTSSMTINLANLSANADLYIRKGARPSTDSYDYKSSKTGTLAESKTISYPSQGIWWIGIWGVHDASYKLTVSGVVNGSISGYILCGNVGVSGVTVTCGSATMTTSASGYYKFSNLTNGPYTVTPSKTGYIFDPATRSYTFPSQPVTNANYTMKCQSGWALLLNKIGSGSVAKSPLQDCYVNGAIVQLSATPGSGYSFAGWSVNGVPTSLPNNKITMSKDSNVAATFRVSSGPIIIPPSLISATSADKDSSGNYWVELIWEEEEAESLVYQVAYKLPSKFTYYYTPVVMADFQIDGSLVGSYLQVPSACDEYELMVRAYDPFTGAFSDWSNSQVATVVPTYPSPPTGVYNFCSDGKVTLVWAVDPNEACAYTDFKVYASTDGSSFGQLPLQVRPNGSKLYSLKTSTCPISGTPATYYKVSALIGENESASTMAVTLAEPPPPQKLGEYSTNLSQSDIRLADLSGDGLYDLVLQSAYLKADPNGTFTDASSKLNTTAGNGDRIRIFDMNGDGLLDRVISHKKTLWVEFNSSSGNFTKGPSVDLGGDIGDFAIGYIPLNISGNAKIAAGLKDKIALIELNAGNGFIVGSTVTTDLDINSVALGDMNNDGLTDIVCGGKKGMRIFSASTYDSAVWNEEIVITSSIISGVDIADANGDGFLDIAVGRQKKDNPLVYLFVPDYGDDPIVRPLAHTWQASQLLDSLTLDNVREVVFADLEGIGYPGLVCVTEQAQQSCFLENDGAGNLRKTAIIFPGLVTAAAVGDFNSDGISDIATVSNKTIDIYSGMLAYDELAETEGVDLPPQKAAFSDTTQKDGLLAIFWYDAMDDRTPPQSLTYEVVAGTADESRDLYQGEIGPNNTSCKPGNRLTSTTVSIPLQGHPGPTYWKVRAVDSCFNKGEWLKGITYSDGTTQIEP